MSYPSSHRWKEQRAELGVELRFSNSLVGTSSSAQCCLFTAQLPSPLLLPWWLPRPRVTDKVKMAAASPGLGCPRNSCEQLYTGRESPHSSPLYPTCSLHSLPLPRAHSGDVGMGCQPGADHRVLGCPPSWWLRCHLAPTAASGPPA